MNLILKRIDRSLIATSLDGDVELIQGERRLNAPFALHTEDGQVLPCQLSTSLESGKGAGFPVLTVTFAVDGLSVVVEGDK